MLAELKGRRLFRRRESTLASDSFAVAEEDISEGENKKVEISFGREMGDLVQGGERGKK